MKIDVKHKDKDGNEFENSMTAFTLRAAIYAGLLFLQVLGVYLIWNSVIVDIFPTVKQIDMTQAICLIVLVDLFKLKI
jgi:hypothetical protein